MNQALIDRNARAERENQERDGKTPEVQLTSLAKRMLDLCTAPRDCP
jgi:hypothetical protein